MTETADARPMAQNHWALAFVLKKMRLDFFQDRANGNGLLGTQGQPSFSTLMTFTTKPQSTMCESPKMLFLGPCEKTQFPLAAVAPTQ